MKPTEQDLRQFKFLEDGVWIGVEEGWYHLLYLMLSEIREYLPTIRGSKKLVEEFKIYRIKEKFGGLRVFTSRHDGGVYNIIKRYNKLSYETCEECGEYGEVRPTTWIKTLCKKHYWKRIWSKERELKVKLKLMWNWIFN